MADWCPGCRGDRSPLAALKSHCAECLAKVEPLTVEQIEAALEEGARARQAFLDAQPTLPGFYR